MKRTKGNYYDKFLFVNGHFFYVYYFKVGASSISSRKFDCCCCGSGGEGFNVIFAVAADNAEAL